MNKKVVKKKKLKLIKARLLTAIFSVMFIVSLFMGINALAETNPFRLTNATIEEKSATTTGSIQSFDNDKVNNNITFHKLNDYVTYKLVIKNNNNDITILSIDDDNNNEYISYEYDKHEDEKVNKGLSFDFLVKAIYKNELTDTSKRNQTTNVRFTITYLEDGKVKGDTITINPKTGDGISKSFVLLIISSVGLITCIAVDKKRKDKKLSKVSMFIITGLLLTPLVVKAASFAYSLSLVSTYQLNDKVVVTIDDKVNEPTKQTIEYNTKIDSLPSVTKEGYTITKWTVNDEEFDITKEITEDITIEAEWTPNNYEIIFNKNASDATGEMSNKVMTYDKKENLPNVTYERYGYVFDSWNTDPRGIGTRYENETEVKNLTTSDNITLYAIWGATPYTVIFDKNSSNATGTMDNISKPYNETFNLPENTYERAGYEFKGWNTVSNGTGTHYDDKKEVKNLDVDGEVTLYAEWVPSLITITYDNNTDDSETSGTMESQIVVYSVRNSINENKFTRTGYAFYGWNTKSDGTGTHYDDKADITNEFVEDTTLYAEWAVTPYTVIFNKNSDEAIGTMENQEIPYDVKQRLTKNTYTREHYKLVGWNTQADGQGTHYDDEQEVKNLDVDGEVNLYAEWKELISTLQTGSNVNAILKNINADATQFKKYSGTPNLDNIDGEQIISLDNSNFPTYAWNDNGTIYWWSEAEKIYMNSNSSLMFSNLNELVSIDASNFNSINVSNMNSIFQNCNKLESLDITGWDTANVTNMGAMFAGCSNLVELDVSNLNTSNVSIINYIFDNMYSLQTINLSNFNLSKIGNNQINLFGYNTKPKTIIMDNAIFNKNMSQLFVNQNKLTTISLENINTSNSENMSELFSGCSSLSFIDVSDFNTSNVTNMSSMFNSCSNLETINGLDSFNTSNVTNMSSMFSKIKNLENLDISSFDSTELTNINNMFAESNFKTIDFGNSFTVEKVTSISQTFFNSSKLISLDLSRWNPTLTNMNYMFYNTYNLEMVDMTGWNFSSITKFTEDFYSANSNTKLTTIYVSDSIPSTATSSTGNDFNNRRLLVGGAGTTMSNVTLEYARIDDPDNGKPGYFTLKNHRYIRYNGNGADSGEMTSHYLNNTGLLKTNAFVRNGYTFVGWNTAIDGTGIPYTNGQLMSDIVESKTPLTLYAQWEKNKTKLYDVANVGNYIEYKPTSTSYKPSNNTGITGTINPSNTTKWRVLSKNSDGTIDIIPVSTSGTLTFGEEGYGKENSAYANYESELQKVANAFINSTYASSARPISENDFKTIKNNSLTITDHYVINKQDYESRSWTGNQEGGANWNYYIYYANASTIEKFTIWYKYAGTGGQSSNGYSINLNIRPIVRLKANLYTNEGNGTSSNAYNILK